MPETKPAEAPSQEVKPEPVKIPEPASVGCEPYRSLISQYDWDVSIAMAVMEAESNCNPSAVGDTSPINGLLAPSCGLYQVRTLRGRPTCEQLKDPATNVEWAYKISGSGSNWKPWSVFTNEKYKKYL